jgi:hypothetical protein
VSYQFHHKDTALEPTVFCGAQFEYHYFTRTYIHEEEETPQKRAVLENLKMFWQHQYVSMDRVRKSLKL